MNFLEALNTKVADIEKPTVMPIGTYIWAVHKPHKESVSKDGKSITGTPQAALGKGAYKVLWTAASADGHKMTGEVTFKVG